MFIRATITLVLSLVFFTSWAQWHVGLGYQHGYNLPLYEDSPDTKSSSSFIHLSLRYESQGRFGLLEAIYKQPTISFQLAYQDLGNKSELGHAITFSPDFKFRWKNWGRTKLFWSGGLGLGWVNKPFDKVTNPGNEAIGTHLNFYAQAHLNLEHRFNKIWMLSFELGFHHLSNGFFAFPNLGVNIPSAGLSIYHRISEPRSFENPDYTHLIHTKTPWRPFFRLIYGATERAFDGPQFGIYGFGLGMSKKIRIHQLVSVGGEYLFDESRYFFLVHVNGKESHEEFHKSSRYLVFVGHEFLMKYFSVVSEVGFYLTQQFDRQSVISTKAGFNVYPFNNLTKWKNQLSIGAFIRGYFLRADFVEFSINYRI